MGVDGGFAWCRVGVDVFAWLEIALKVGAREVPTTDAKSLACGKGGENAEGGCSEGAGPVLIIVSTGDLEVALDDEPGLERAVPLRLTLNTQSIGMAL